MAQLTGNEFQNEKGTQGSLLKWIWGRIYTYFNGVYDDAVAYVNNALGNVYTKAESDALLSPIASNVSTLQGGLTAELVARADGDTVLQSALNALTAQVVGLKTITAWDATTLFPTLRSDGAAFSKGNYVQVTVSSGIYKAGDMLICTVDGATTVADFGDVDSNVDIATDSVYGTVKLVASLAEYNGTDSATGSKVISKSVLQAILTEVTAAITTAYQNADSALQASITSAYQTAISTALGNVYTKSEVDVFVSTINGNVSSLQGAVSALQTAVAGKSDTVDVVALANALKAAIAGVSAHVAKFTTSIGVNQPISSLFTVLNGKATNTKTNTVGSIRWAILNANTPTGLSLKIWYYTLPDGAADPTFASLVSTLGSVSATMDLFSVRKVTISGTTETIENTLIFNPDVFLSDAEISACYATPRVPTTLAYDSLIADIDTAIAGL